MTISDLDFKRSERRGFPETVLCAWKSNEQLIQIFSAFAHQGKSALGTRATPEQIEQLMQQADQGLLPPVYADISCGVVAMDGIDRSCQAVVAPLRVAPLDIPHVALIAAGTSDYRVIREAAAVCTYFDVPYVAHMDKGVACIERILRTADCLKSAVAVIVAAGMDGALPSVCAGLVSVPIIAVPTSVGYGASFDGLAALLSMLNSCSEGVSVVNIDNGFGAAYQAAQIYRLLV